MLPITTIKPLNIVRLHGKQLFARLNTARWDSRTNGTWKQPLKKPRAILRGFFFCDVQLFFLQIWQIAWLGESVNNSCCNQGPHCQHCVDPNRIISHQLMPKTPKVNWLRMPWPVNASVRRPIAKPSMAKRPLRRSAATKRPDLLCSEASSWNQSPWGWEVESIYF